MSVQTITGVREYNFTDETTGREVKGLSVYYAEKLADKDGMRAKGFTIGKLSVQPGTELYTRMLNANYDKPFEADIKFDIIPNKKRPVLVDIVFKQ